jgi:hypothetical protein
MKKFLKDRILTKNVDKVSLVIAKLHKIWETGRFNAFSTDIGSNYGGHHSNLYLERYLIFCINVSFILLTICVVIALCPSPSSSSSDRRSNN